MSYPVCEREIGFMSNYYERLGSLALVKQLVSEKQNFEFKPALLRLIELILCFILSVREELGLWVIIMRDWLL